MTQEQREALVLIRAALLEIRGSSSKGRTLLLTDEAAVEDRDDYLGHMNRVADISLHLLTLIDPQPSEKARAWANQLFQERKAGGETSSRWITAILANESKNDPGRPAKDLT